MSLKEKILADLKQAMLAKDQVRISTLRLVLADITNKEKAASASYQANDPDVLGILNKQVKQREESIEMFKKGARADLAEKESRELVIIKSYFPEQLPDQEIERLVAETIKETGAVSIRDMGKVMGALVGKIAGRASGEKLSQLVREKLPA